MKKLITLIVLAASFNVFAQHHKDTGGPHTMYGSDHSYELTPPDGWVVSTKKGIHRGMMGVFYPEGISWHKASTIMYTNSSHLTAEQKHIENVIAYDQDEFMKHSPGIEIPHGHDLKLHDGETAVIYKYRGGTEDHHEAVAYIGEEHIVVLIVIACSTEDELDRHYNDFVKLVESFKWIGEDSEENEEVKEEKAE